MAQNKTNHDASTSSIAVRCNETIVLLELISQLPGQPPDAGPQFLPREPEQEDDNRRILSLQQENEIVSSLAFLSGVSNSPNHITAVCLEEIRAKDGCKVLLAINKLHPNSGKGILEKIKRGFEQIFKRLSAVSSRSRREDRNKIIESVFNDVVALCRDRILNRLRVKASTGRFSKKEGRFIGDNLEGLLKYPWRTRMVTSDMTATRLERYRVLSQTLLKDLSMFNAAGDWRHERVVELVQRIADFMEEVPFEDVIESLEDHPMDRSAKFRLHNCLSKIARYRQSVLLLSRLTKKIPILRRVTVDYVCLDQAAFQRPSQSLGPSNLNTVLKAIPHNIGSLQINDLPNWTQKSQWQFTDNVEKALQESKIHAEIQIVAHYEAAHPSVVAPRVIASSKDACYLCHAFIRLHGKYTVPRSHGKLYTGWRLPAIQGFEETGYRLQGFLEQEILANIMRFAGLKGRPPVAFPNESTLFPLNISASTLYSCVDLPSHTQHDHATNSCPPKALKKSSIAETDEDQPNHDLHHPPSSSAVHEVEGSIDEANVSTTVKPTAKMASSDSNVGSSSSNATRSQGRAGALPEPVLWKTRRFYHEGKEIFVEDSSSSTRIRWLNSADSAEILREKAGAVVDVTLLATGTDTQSLQKGPDNICYFAFGQQVVMIETSLL